MKNKLHAVFALFVVSASCLFAQSLGRFPNTVIPLDRGIKDDANLRTVISSMASNRPAMMLLDGGTWQINTNLTIPTNVFLVLARDTVLSIRAGKTLTINGEFFAGPHNCFTGLGTVVRTALPVEVGGFPYRCPEWGNSNQFNIGKGYLEVYVTNMIAALAPAYVYTFDTNFSYFYLNNTTQSLYDLIVRDRLYVSNGAVFWGGVTNHGYLETDTLQVNSNLAVSGAAMTNALNPVRYDIASNMPVFGFVAWGATNRSVAMAGSTFTKQTGMVYEAMDSHNCFTADRFTPTNSGWYELEAAATMYAQYYDTPNDPASLHGYYIVRNGDVGKALIRTNMISLGTHTGGGGSGTSGAAADKAAYNGSGVFFANGSSDYFELYGYSFYGNTNLQIMFNGHFIGK